MSTVIHERVRQANKGENPLAIAKLRSGWVVLGDVQPLTGYCILLSDPVVTDLNHLDERGRTQYLLDMSHVGDALLKAFGPEGAYRINYETWGNLDPALHTHITPRFTLEPDEKRVLPPRFAYDWANARKSDPVQDAAVMRRIREALAPYSVV